VYLKVSFEKKAILNKTKATSVNELNTKKRFINFSEKAPNIPKNKDKKLKINKKILQYSFKLKKNVFNEKNIKKKKISLENTARKDTLAKAPY
jgi:hypothetical protein